VTLGGGKRLKAVYKRRFKGVDLSQCHILSRRRVSIWKIRRRPPWVTYLTRSIFCIAIIVRKMSENENANAGGDAPQMVSLTDLDLKSLAEVKKQLEEVCQFILLLELLA
jgi:hypothetical protein